MHGLRTGNTRHLTSRKSFALFDKKKRAYMGEVGCVCFRMKKKIENKGIAKAICSFWFLFVKKKKETHVLAALFRTKLRTTTLLPDLHVSVTLPQKNFFD